MAFEKIAGPLCGNGLSFDWLLNVNSGYDVKPELAFWHPVFTDIKLW